MKTATRRRKGWFHLYCYIPAADHEKVSLQIISQDAYVGKMKAKKKTVLSNFPQLCQGSLDFAQLLLLYSNVHLNSAQVLFFSSLSIEFGIEQITIIIHNMKCKLTKQNTTFRA